MESRPTWLVDILANPGRENMEGFGDPSSPAKSESRDFLTCTRNSGHIQIGSLCPLTALGGDCGISDQCFCSARELWLSPL